MSDVTLPNLEWVPTRAQSSRRGASVRLVVVHRWAGGSLQGVERWFENPSHEASSHLVYAGEEGPNAGRCAQMVPWSQKAWTEALYNAQSVEVECADAIWIGSDFKGLHRTARIVAFLLHKYGLPPVHVTGAAILHGRGGWCRHADLGAAGGGHTQCPSTDPTRIR